MAKVVAGDLTRRRGRRQLYPWDEWLDGRQYELVRGVDYHSKTSGFRMQIGAAARGRGLIANVVTVDENTLRIQAKPRE